MQVKNGEVRFEHVSFSIVTRRQGCALGHQSHISIRQHSGGSSAPRARRKLARTADPAPLRCHRRACARRRRGTCAITISTCCAARWRWCCRKRAFSGDNRRQPALGEMASAQTKREIRHVAHLACADEFIDQMPEGYDTHIEQGGFQCLRRPEAAPLHSRALLKQPKILILDSTSAVDTRTDVINRACGNISRPLQDHHRWRVFSLTSPIRSSCSTSAWKPAALTRNFSPAARSIAMCESQPEKGIGRMSPRHGPMLSHRTLKASTKYLETAARLFWRLQSAARSCRCLRADQRHRFCNKLAFLRTLIDDYITPLIGVADPT